MAGHSMLSPSQAEALRRYLSAPPKGSAVARALEFGIDLSLTVHNAYGLSSEQRLAKLEQHLAEAGNREPIEHLGPLNR